MTEAEFLNILEQVERIAATKDKFNIDVVARLTRLKQGLGRVLAEAGKNPGKDEESVRSPGWNIRARI